jgi:spermidine/putrescine-binding protein
MELFINKEAVVGQLTDGRVRMAQDLGAPVGWTVPKEGVLIFIDTFAIPKTAKNVENAHKFINFLLRPDIQLKQLRGMRYDAVNAAARQLLEPDELKRFEPPAGAKLILGDLAPAEVLQKASEIWNEVKLA